MVKIPQELLKFATNCWVYENPIALDRDLYFVSIDANGKEVYTKCNIPDKFLARFYGYHMPEVLDFVSETEDELLYKLIDNSVSGDILC